MDVGSLRSIYFRAIHDLKAEAEKSDVMRPKPFLETGFGSLAPEIRQMIFTRLLAIPPPFGGHTFRIEQTPLMDRFPEPLAKFVDLKTSSLTVLQTCRHIYSEAFSVFYACGSYYLTNAQDLVAMMKYSGLTKPFPWQFRVDTVASLCLKNLVINKPKWTPQSVDQLVSETSFTREELEAERTEELDLNLMFVDLEEMRGLRKICFCMRVGQEWEHLKFLFNVRGLARGVIDFVDNSHWIIRSQDVSGNEWKLQYTPFSGFYGKGKNLELLDYEVIEIQEEVLNIDSRASDQDEGDERWVEVDIGTRNYDEKWPDLERPRVAVPSSSSGNQQGESHEEGLISSEWHSSDHESEHLQGQLNGEENGAQTDNESDQDTGDLQDQLHGEEEEVEEENDQDQESEILQAQLPEDTSATTTNDEPDEKFSNPQHLTDGDDDSAQAVNDTNQDLEPPKEHADHDWSAALPETMLIEKPGIPQDPHGEQDRHASTSTEPDEILENPVESVPSSTAIVQSETDAPQDHASVSEGGQGDSFEAQREEKTATTTHHQGDQDNRAITGQMDLEHGKAETQKKATDSPETQTKSPNVAKDFELASQAATKATTTQKALNSDHDPTFEPKVRNKQPLPALPKFKPVKKKTANSSQNPDSLRTLQLSKPAIEPVDHSSHQPPKYQRQPASLTNLTLHGSVRAVALVLALHMFGLVLHADPENTLGQLVALFLSILLFFVVLS